MVAAMTAYWNKHPPVHLLVAADIGYKPGLAPISDAGEPVENVAQFDGCAANSYSADDFDALLRSKGIDFNG